MRRSPLDDAGFNLFFRSVRPTQDLDIDLLEFADPYPNVEEILIAAETFAHRGFWSFGTEREGVETVKSDRDFRKKRRVRHVAPISGNPESEEEGVKEG